jgi:hypothetical protein
VRQGLPHRRDEEAREGRHRPRGGRPVRGLQELHHGLPLGHAAVGPGHEQGGQVRLLHGPCRCRPATGLRDQVRYRLPVLRPGHRGARPARERYAHFVPPKRRVAREGAAMREPRRRPAACPPAAGLARRRGRPDRCGAAAATLGAALPGLELCPGPDAAAAAAVGATFARRNGRGGEPTTWPGAASSAAMGRRRW